MNFKNIVLVTIASTVLLAPIPTAFAYSIEYKNERYTVICDDGYRWTYGDGTQEITHSQARRGCAERGSSIAVPTGDTKPRPAKRDTSSNIQKK
ncbi:hypothetical protein [Aquamicrobium zhengzhouense]|uniref:hypothetical protein n=1 Tax=Aquamicrobium zhengzhouense TaxID=2781738 RepID=UPI001AEDE3EC|nr:hypothetical protein [Aquamicrobium zhengzhouense]